MPLSKGAIATWSVLIYWQVRDTLSSVTQCQGATYSIQNRVLTGHAFRTKPCATMECCVILCGEDPNCKSINYYRKTKTCELNNVSTVVSPESMVDFELSMYMTNAFSPCHLDFECEGQGRICQVMEGWSYCKVCMEALGLEDKIIPDSSITASSGAQPSLFRLNSPSAWVADHSDPEPWIQVDLGKDAVIKKIATQGKLGAYQWVRTYTLSSRANGDTDWVTYKENDDEKVFQGNNDQTTVISHVLPQHIRARFVRFWPKTWTYIYRAMRAEVYGCFLR